jgi:hypothetical protein
MTAWSYYEEYQALYCSFVAILDLYLTSDLCIHPRFIKVYFSLARRAVVDGGSHEL